MVSVRRTLPCCVACSAGAKHQACCAAQPMQACVDPRAGAWPGLAGASCWQRDAPGHRFGEVKYALVAGAGVAEGKTVLWPCAKGAGPFILTLRTAQGDGVLRHGLSGKSSPLAFVQPSNDRSTWPLFGPWPIRIQQHVGRQHHRLCWATSYSNSAWRRA